MFYMKGLTKKEAEEKKKNQNKYQPLEVKAIRRRKHVPSRAVTSLKVNNHSKIPIVINVPHANLNLDTGFDLYRKKAPAINPTLNPKNEPPVQQHSALEQPDPSVVAASANSKQTPYSKQTALISETATKKQTEMEKQKQMSFSEFVESLDEPFEKRADLKIVEECSNELSDIYMNGFVKWNKTIETKDFGQQANRSYSRHEITQLILDDMGNLSPPRSKSVSSANNQSFNIFDYIKQDNDASKSRFESGNGLLGFQSNLREDSKAQCSGFQFGNRETNHDLNELSFSRFFK